MQIEPYLFFDGNCEEALDFYQDALGGQVRQLMRYGGSPMDTPELPAAWKSRVLHATLDVAGQRFMAADAMPGNSMEAYAGFSISVNIPQDRAKAEKIFHALSSDGTVTQPFGPTFWGALFGMVVDKFGVPWMVNCDLAPADR
ncbi:MAG: VOC family protein [Pseudomonadota bacterium]